MRSFHRAASIAFAAIGLSVVRAQTPQTLPPDEIARRIAQAVHFGGGLYALDRAAAVATRDMLMQVPADQLAGPGGFIVELASEATLKVTYYRGQPEQAQAFFVAEVRDFQVFGHQRFTEPVALSPAQIVVAKARLTAKKAAEKSGDRPCTKAPFDIVVLPPQPDGIILVYLLSSQLDAQTYMLGGAYRIVIDESGEVISQRPYSVSCLAMSRPKEMPSGGKLVGLTVTHLLDPVPTEMHVLASLMLQLPVTVATNDNSVWRVTGTTIDRVNRRP